MLSDDESISRARLRVARSADGTAAPRRVAVSARGWPGAARGASRIDLDTELLRPDLDPEAEGGKPTREPLPPAARDPGRYGAAEIDDVKRLVGPLHGRRRRRS
jgi:hypothetical protein